jgi:hypothetical protein
MYICTRITDYRLRQQHTFITSTAFRANRKRNGDDGAITLELGRLCIQWCNNLCIIHDR